MLMNAPKITTRVTIHLYCNLAPRGCGAAVVGTCTKASLLVGNESYKLTLTNLQGQKNYEVGTRRPRSQTRLISSWACTTSRERLSIKPYWMARIMLIYPQAAASVLILGSR